MSDLKQALERWNDLTPAERKILIIVHVHGDTVENLYDFELGGRWCAESWTSGISVWCKDGKPYRLLSEYDPLTDRNDCAEAVRAFYPKCTCVQAEKFYNATGSYMSGSPAGIIIRAILLAPSDACRAILEALAESEADDGGE